MPPTLGRFTGEMSLAANVGLLIRSPDITQPSQHVTLPGVLLFSLVIELLPFARDLDSAGHKFDEYATFWRFARDHKLEDHALEKPVIDVCTCLPGKADHYHSPMRANFNSIDPASCICLAN